MKIIKFLIGLWGWTTFACVLSLLIVFWGDLFPKNSGWEVAQAQSYTLQVQQNGNVATTTPVVVTPTPGLSQVQTIEPTQGSGNVFEILQVFLNPPQPSYEQPIYATVVTITPTPFQPSYDQTLPVEVWQAPTAEYVYHEGVVPLWTTVAGDTANVLPPIPPTRDIPPCDMNPMIYFRSYGSDLLYDLAKTRDGKICAWVNIPFCPAQVETPWGDWKMAMMADEDLPDEGTVDDIVLYGSDVLKIAEKAGAFVDIDEEARIFILEDEFDVFGLTLLEHSCSDPEGRFVLQSAGVYKLLEYLKAHIVP